MVGQSPELGFEHLHSRDSLPYHGRLVRGAALRKGSAPRIPKSVASFAMCYGPEYISGKLIAWAETHHISIRYIQPGKPQQNAYVERYNRTVHHEWLDQHIIESIERHRTSPFSGYGRITTNDPIWLWAG